jgi:molecular chaperone DnaJ
MANARSHSSQEFKSGHQVVLKDLGIARLRGGGRGDLTAHLEVATPTKLSREEEELLKKLAALRNRERFNSDDSRIR